MTGPASPGVVGAAAVAEKPAADQAFDVVVERESARRSLSLEFGNIQNKMWRQLHASLSELQRASTIGRESTEIVL